MKSTTTELEDSADGSVDAVLASTGASVGLADADAGDGDGDGSDVMVSVVVTVSAGTGPAALPHPVKARTAAATSACVFITSLPFTLECLPFRAADDAPLSSEMPPSLRAQGLEGVVHLELVGEVAFHEVVGRDEGHG